MCPLSLVWRPSRFKQWAAATFRVTNYERAAPRTSNCSARQPQQHRVQLERRRRRRFVCLSLWWKTFREASRCHADAARASVSRTTAENKTGNEIQMERKSPWANQSVNPNRTFADLTWKPAQLRSEATPSQFDQSERATTGTSPSQTNERKIRKKTQ